METKLVVDVKNGKQGLYGKSGDTVKVITLHHVPVVIVEDGKGNRFSCLISETDLDVKTGKPIDQK